MRSCAMAGAELKFQIHFIKVPSMPPTLPTFTTVFTTTGKNLPETYTTAELTAPLDNLFFSTTLQGAVTYEADEDDSDEEEMTLEVAWCRGRGGEVERYHGMTSATGR